ncbi:MAG: endolytic transglycosylase MltG [Anaerolineales bacterium]
MRFGLGVLVLLMVAGITFVVGWRWVSPSPSPGATPTAELTEVARLPLRIETSLPTMTPQPTMTLTLVPTITQTRVLPSATLALTHTPSPVPSLSPTPHPCPPPPDWSAHTVQDGETLFAYQLGVDSAVTVDEIMAANCLNSRYILTGQVLYLPPGAAENAPSSQALPTALPSGSGGGPRPADCPCTVRIPQAYRLEQVAAIIDSLPVAFRGVDLRALRIGDLPPRAVFAGASPAASLEGYLFPGSYSVTNEMGAVDFVLLVVDTLAAQAGDLLGQAGALTPYEVLTLASIVNRESRSPGQQVLIASVFHNRLASGRGLGATVTTQYALGVPGNWWPNVHGRVSTTDSPYNTNIYTGLPPSPIASPSLDALRATVNPAQTNYLYFTGDCRGAGNAFAQTYDEHLANVRCE